MVVVGGEGMAFDSLTTIRFRALSAVLGMH